MICQFSFKNFLSYKNQTVFDFQAAAIPEFSNGIIVRDKASSLLPVGVVYGPNGGGKSNLLKALACLITTVVNPVRQLKKSRVSLIIQNSVSAIPFLLDEGSNKLRTEFQIFFRTNGNEYQYNLAVLNDEVKSESLYWRSVGGKRTGTVFEREENDIALGASINKNSVNTQINPKMPYLSFLAINYDIPAISEVITWFESCIIQNYANPDVEENFYLPIENHYKHELICALNDLDVDIADYVIDIEDSRIYIIREINNQSYRLLYDYESAGTQKLLKTLPIILLALREGRLLVVDELDAKLHPKLLRYIIKLFHDPKVNTKGAQLLFTSHDMTTMRNDVFRRDEIWFACENDAHESEVYSLYDIRDENGKHVNSTSAYDKQYLEGRYGADPYLQNILGGEWNELKAD